MQENLALRYYTRHFSEFTTHFYVKKYAIEFEVYLRSGCQTVIVKNAFDHRQWNTTKCGKTNEVFRRKHEKRKTDQFATWLLLIDTWTEQLYLTLKSRIKWWMCHHTDTEHQIQYLSFEIVFSLCMLSFE